MSQTWTKVACVACAFLVVVTVPMLIFGDHPWTDWLIEAGPGGFLLASVPRLREDAGRRE